MGKSSNRKRKRKDRRVKTAPRDERDKEHHDVVEASKVSKRPRTDETVEKTSNGESEVYCIAESGLDLFVRCMYRSRPAPFSPWAWLVNNRARAPPIEKTKCVPTTLRDGCDICTNAPSEMFSIVSWTSLISCYVRLTSCNLRPATDVCQEFPYPTDQDDHCESPLEAYQDVVPFLRRLEHVHRSSSKSFVIYDPYYCDGAVCRNLKQLGFDNVYNKKEDCYEQWKSASNLQVDVLLTNPPYSGDHIERLLQYVASNHQRPFFLLLPNWVVKKDFYQTHTANIYPFYLVPRKRYIYLPPKGFRDSRKSDTHKKSAPFVSMWYCWGGNPSMNDELIRLFYSNSAAQDISCDLARSKSALRDLRRKVK